MGKDELFYKTRAERKKREKNIREQIPNNWLIVSEGTKTEPIYFEYIIKKINEVMPPHAKIVYDIHGQGKNTLSLVKSVDDLQCVVDEIIRKKIIKYDKIFVVFDRDSFPEKLFNKALALCKKNGYIALWSNESIEFWFMLYFNYYDCQMCRSDYIKKLNKEFKKNNNPNCYEKNSLESIKFIVDNFSLKYARANAKKINQKMIDEKIVPVNANSSTMIYKFFDIIDERNKCLGVMDTKNIFK